MKSCKHLLLSALAVLLLIASATTHAAAANFTISVKVNGLSGTLVVQDNESDTLTFTANGTQTFATSYAGGSTYSVTVKTQPVGQTCTLSANASGTINSNITVTANCVSTFTISVAVTGLSGALVVQDNKSDLLTFTKNNTQTFATGYPSGAAYTVTIVTQPIGQTCTLSSNSKGSITSNITVTATCTASTGFTISVAVTGLTGTLVVGDSPTDTLTFTTNTTKTFATTYLSGVTYAVTIKTQPAGQTCTLSANATGIITGNITVTATCVASGGSFTISVAVTGLTSGTLVVEDSPTDTLSFTTNTTKTFATKYASGSTYAVTVKTQPAGQTCTLSSNATGTITGNITVTATCAASAGSFTISVAVTGLTGTLVVEDSPTDTLTFTTNTTKTFATKYASGASYSVTVVTQPSGQTCTLSSNATGTITGNITVTATCAASAGSFTISVAVTGLTGTLVVEDSPTDQLTFTTNTTKTFATKYASGASYSVTVVTQPSGQTCTLSSNATGTITGNITVTATCAASAGSLTISVAVTGLTGTLVVEDSPTDTLTFTTNTTKTFATKYASGASYSVTVLTQPLGQTCTLGSNASGTITSNITVKATCSTASTLTLSVAVVSLDGGTLVVKDDKAATLTFTSNITQTFSNTYASGATYTVSVKTQPAGQTCVPGSNASGTITSNTIVTVTCTIPTSFFGADFIGSNIWPPTDGLGNIPTLGGMRLWGGNVQWADVNPSTQNVFVWTDMDAWIADAQSEGWDVLYTFGNTPQWAGSIPAGNPCLIASGPYSCSPPNDLNADGTGTDADFSDFVTGLVTRYKGEIAYYELWDEPDCTCYFAGTTAQIVRMGADAAAIIRSIDPNARILSPSFHGPTARTWFADYIAGGGQANFDIVNAHMRGTGINPNGVPESFIVMYADVIAETAVLNLQSLPLWDDEHGIKVGQLSDPDELAGYVARSAVLRAGVGLQRQYVYTWDEGDTLGLQGNESGTAWDVVAGWLIGHTINACVASGTVYTCLVDDGQIVWDTAQTCSNGVCTTSNYTYPPAYTFQTNLSGTKTALAPPTVPIGYKPIFLTSK